MTRTCCTTWDDNTVIAETPLMRAVLDAHPVTEGHTLIVPKRHVDRLTDLLIHEANDLLKLIATVQLYGDAYDWTIAVNDGPLAGRTVPHLHVHVIPRRAGDVPDPRGGVRRLLIPDVADDPWITQMPQPLITDPAELTPEQFEEIRTAIQQSLRDGGRA